MRCFCSQIVCLLQEAVDSLKSILEKNLQWTFRTRELQEFASDDEYAPVIVDHF